jgi:hypothetical protein
MEPQSVTKPNMPIPVEKDDQIQEELRGMGIQNVLHSNRTVN